MVKSLILLFLSMMIHVNLFTVDVKVTAGIDDAYANEKGIGSVSITHNYQDKIDLASFRLGSNPLSVTFVKDVPFSSENATVVSIYKFEIPGQNPGLYVLPSVTVRVGDKNYQSFMSSYSVKNEKKSNASKAANSTPVNSAPAPSSPVEPSLRLTAGIEGATSIYPGQRTKFVYHYYYTGTIELATEKLPLLDAQGLIKIGEKEFHDYAEGGVSVSEISQEVEGIKPGKFSFGPSLIEGYSYEVDASGKHVPTSPKISSEVPEVVLTVLPFPTQGKPASFNGTIGKKFQFSVDLIGDKTIVEGDMFSLGINITGEPGTNIKQVPLPEVCCQPGFSGFFRLSDLPPTEEIKDNTKKAIVQLSPLTAKIEEIPSLEFAYFNPETTSYTVLSSQPIPIKVIPRKKASVENPVPAPTKEQSVQPKSNVTPTRTPSMQSPQPIEIEGIYQLHPRDLHDQLFGSWWALLIFPLGIALFIFQYTLHQSILLQRSRGVVETSATLFQKALESSDGSAQYFRLISQALKQSLVEKNVIPSAEIANSELPEQGIAGEIRAFLFELDEDRFTQGRKIDYTKINQSVESLLNKNYGDHLK